MAPYDSNVFDYNYAELSRFLHAVLVPSIRYLEATTMGQPTDHCLVSYSGSGKQYGAKPAMSVLLLPRMLYFTFLHRLSTTGRGRRSLVCVFY